MVGLNVYRILSLLVSVTLFLQGKASDEELHREKRAIGGEGFSRGDWPWLVLMKATIVTERLFGIFPVRHHHIYCGGALISDRWILSAAHCFRDNGDQATRPRNWEARLASVRLRPNMRQRVLDVLGRVFNNDDMRQWELDVDTIIVHPNYGGSESLNNDIALVRLSEPFPDRSSFISPIRLPSEDAQNFPQIGQTCITKGWGCTSRGGGPSTTAHQIEMPVSDNGRCRNFYTDIDSMQGRICAGQLNNGVGVCSGDSGSPLVCADTDGQYTMAGIVSFTSRDHPDNFPAVFTRIQSYIPWINAVMEAY